MGELRRLRRERDDLHAAQADAARRLDLLRYQVDEITGAGLRPEEEEELVAEKRVLANAEKLAILAGSAADLLSGADAGARGVLDALNDASTALAELTRLDESQAETLESLNGALYTLEEVSRTLRSYASAIASTGWASGSRRRRGNSTTARTTPMAQSNAATAKAPLNPWVRAIGNAEPPCSALAERLVETEDRIARPSEPPTCWVVLSSPDASPESPLATPLVAAIVIGTNDIPRPAPRTIMAGRTWLA